MNRILRIGIVQQANTADMAQNRARLAERISQLAGDGARLVVLQELHDSPYFCQTENPDQFDLAEPIPGPATAFYSDVARRHGVVLVTSLFERRAAGLYHNTAVVFESDGSIAGRYRKMHIPDDPAYYEKFYFTPGDLGSAPSTRRSGGSACRSAGTSGTPRGHASVAMQGAERGSSIPRP